MGSRRSTHGEDQPCFEVTKKPSVRLEPTTPSLPWRLLTSPDGKDIVFDSFETDLPFSALFAVSVHGGRLKPVTDHPVANNYDPSWVQPLTRCTVPKLKGKTLVATKRLVALAGCSLGKVTGPKKNRNKLHVVNQKPRAGTNVATGTKVKVQIR
jgi:hypothetical protein